MPLASKTVQEILLKRACVCASFPREVLVLIPIGFRLHPEDHLVKLNVV